MADGTGQVRREGRRGARPDDIRGEFTIVAVPGTHRDNGKHKYGGHGNANARGRLSKAEKQKVLLDARRMGLSWREAGKRAGYRSVGAAYQAGSEAIADIPREAADEVRTIEMQRLDELVRAMWPSMLAGDPHAGMVILKAVERRCRMLGLDMQEPPEGITLDANVQALVIELVNLPPEEFELREGEIARLTGGTDQRSPADPAGAGRTRAPIEQ